MTKEAQEAELRNAVTAIVAELLKGDLESHVNAAAAVLQERLDEIAANLGRQIEDAMEDHRRVPHVGGQRVDDLQRRVDQLEGA